MPARAQVFRDRVACSFACSLGEWENSVLAHGGLEMRGKPLFLALVLALALPVVTQAAPAATISGNYVEFRNADVYTGPCFAYSEVGLTGENAVLAWQI